MRVSDGVWTNAIARAQGLGHRPELVERTITRHGSVARHYTVESSQGGESYPVLVEVAESGEVSVLCLCEAGRRDIPCWHSAAALLASGHLKPEPTEEVRRRGRAALALLSEDEAA
jgi:hypothetical protein